jgi:carbon catabolite-derepressing protein kinase
VAQHTYTKHQVALKILSRSRIVSLNMVDSTPTDIILVLEYAGGELFNRIVEKGRMEESEARVLFQQILFAVEHCHSKKIVHRFVIK